MPIESCKPSRQSFYCKYHRSCMNRGNRFPTWPANLPNLIFQHVTITTSHETLVRFGKYHIARLRAAPHGVPSPKSLEVDLRNLNRWEPGSWDLPLHMGSQVPSRLRLICAISVVESMEVGTYHFTWRPKSQVWRGCLCGINSLRWGLGVGSSKKLDPTLNTNLGSCFFCIKESRSDCNEYKSWDLVPHVNWPLYGYGQSISTNLTWLILGISWWIQNWAC